MTQTPAVPLNTRDVANFRKSLGLNQSQFWRLFGVTQSGGSRYEDTRDIPASTAMLLILYSLNIVSNADLELAVGILRQQNVANDMPKNSGEH